MKNEINSRKKTLHFTLVSSKYLKSINYSKNIKGLDFKRKLKC